MYKNPYDRRRPSNRREGRSKDLTIKVPLSYFKEGQNLVIDYAVPSDLGKDSASVEEYRGTLVGMDQHQNTLIDTEDGERIFLRGARVIKIKIES